ncbi:hypothetical protein GCK72_006388 [Caenorhabditis remanei]|uniref:Uncharacterized protein n=5 Tax=Caenorhabditis remanei TaxID=31234 RepID=A0A6A5HH90_CAERE|nr:hypothetical protein GCK72_006388 [Caenorhabditis remanei]KAF1766431.1 hypothetical protein GCK72_006388 [Caenorhabditis remanei]
MSLRSNKLLVAAVIFTVVTFGLLLSSSILNNKTTTSLTYGGILPKFGQRIIEKKSNEEYIIEKIEHTQKDGEDVRSTRYLTHHSYLLRNLAKMEVKHHGKDFSINDICYKPHNAIFETTFDPENIDKLPNYLQRLILEAQRLSPCLIVTPLNCYHDGYRIHSEMSKWNTSNVTNFLNRKLRNSYIDAIGESEERPYVKSTYGPDLIKEWAHLMFKLPSKQTSSFSKKDLSSKIELWLSSIESKTNLTELGRPSEVDNYFDICTSMQQVHDFDERKRKFGLYDDDDEFLIGLDCVENKTKFIEWIQERELRRVSKPFNPNQQCDGIFKNSEGSGLEFFYGTRSFGNNTAPFDKMKAEIGLMTPEQILTTMLHSDYVNGFESIWTIERAQELLDDFRLAIRQEVKRFNENRSSLKIGVDTRVVEREESNETELEISSNLDSVVYFILFIRCVLLIFFAFFAWSVNPLRSAVMFLVRDALTSLLFSILCKSDGHIELNSELLGYIILLTIVNTYLTTRVSWYKDRNETCIQRAKDFPSRSNFSLLFSIDSLRENCDSRQLQYALAKLSKYLTALDTYSTETFMQLPNYWPFISILFVPITGCYWYFVDFNLPKIFVVLLPSFIVTTIEQRQVEKSLLKERKAKKEFQKVQKKKMEKFLSDGAVDRLLSGNLESVEDKKLYKSKDCVIHKESAGRLYELSRSSYDVSKIMAYPNQRVRDFRFDALGCYFWLMKLKSAGILLYGSAILFVLLSVAVMFIPIQRTSLQKDMNNEVYFGFSINNMSSDWTNINKKLHAFNSEIDSIQSLQTISNWKKGFDRFEGRFYKNSSRTSDANHYVEWMNQEPINWSVMAPLTRISPKFGIPSPFKFRFRYQIEVNNNESEVIDTVQRIDTLLTKYKGTLSSPIVDGVLYEYYHGNAAVWNSFVFNELLASGILSAFFALIVVIFSITPSISSVLIFSFFVIGSRLEIAAVISLFSLDNQQLYTDSAVLVGFLVAWAPFYELSLFRRRLLYKLKTRCTPELSSGKRIRPPFTKAVDTAQVFAIVLAASLIIAVVAGVVPEFQTFFWPTVILIVVQLVAFGNSIAVLVATNQMFEREVRNFLDNEFELGNGTTAGQVCHMAQKLIPPKYDIPIPMNDFHIRPTNMSKFYAPPPAKKRAKQTNNETDPEKKEDEPGTSNANNVSQEEAAHRLAILPWHFVLGGIPVDLTTRSDQIINGPFIGISSDAMRTHEINSELEDQDDYSSESSVEDVESDPAPEEEIKYHEENMLHMIEKVQKDAAEKEAKEKVHQVESAQRRAPNFDDPNVAGPSHRYQRNEERISTDIVPADPPREIPANPVPPPTHVLVQRAPRPHEMPPVIDRTIPRDPRTEPPNLQECIQQNDDPSLPPHPRRHQYPDHYGRAMISYCEDVYWTYNDGRLPPNIAMPPRPFDWHYRRVAPPEDFNYVPPPGQPSIPIPAEAMALREERARAHREQEQRDNSQSPSPSPEPGL